MITAGEKNKKVEHNKMSFKVFRSSPDSNDTMSKEIPSQENMLINFFWNWKTKPAVRVVKQLEFLL